MKERAGYEFVVKGRRVRATREAVEKALEGVQPETISAHAVVIRGRRYPVKQAFAVAFGIAPAEFVTNTATRVLQRLGFEVYSTTATARTDAAPSRKANAAEQRPKPRFPYTAWMPKAAEVERLDLRAIELRWSEWHRWEDLLEDDRGGRGVQVPDGSPGVYEAKLEGETERLTIGKASDLRARVKQGLIKGNRPHPAGAKIRANEDLSQVRVRWAVAERPAAAEEELHKRHQRKHGRLPKYTAHT